MPLSCNQQESSEETTSLLASMSGARRRDCDHEGGDDDPLSASESLGFAQLESMMAGGGNVSVHGFSAESLRFLDGGLSAEETVQHRRGRQGTGKIDGLPAGIDVFEGPEGYGVMSDGRFRSAGNEPHSFMQALLWAVTADSAVKVTRRMITRELNNLADFVENRLDRLVYSVESPLADNAVRAWWRSTQWGRDGKPPSPAMDELAAGKLAWNCDLTRLVRLYLSSDGVSEIFRAATSSVRHSTPAGSPESHGEASKEPAVGSAAPSWGEQPNWEFFKERRWKFFTPDDSGDGFSGAAGHIPSEAGAIGSDVDEEDDGYMTLLGFRVRRQTVRSALHALMLTGNVAQEIQRFNAVPPPRGRFRRGAAETSGSETPFQMPYGESVAFDPDEETIIEFINDEGVPVREPSWGVETLVDRTGPVGVLGLAGNLVHDFMTYIEKWPDVLASAAPHVVPVTTEPSLAEQEASDALAQLAELADEESPSLLGPSAYIRLRGVLCNIHVSGPEKYNVYMHLNDNVTKILDLSMPFVLHSNQYYPVVRSNGVPSDFLSGADAYVLTTYFRSPESPGREITVVFHFGHLWPLRNFLEDVSETLLRAAVGVVTKAFVTPVMHTDTEKFAIKQRQDFHDFLERLAGAAKLANYYLAARNDPAGSFILDHPKEIHLIKNTPVKLQDSRYYNGAAGAHRSFSLVAPAGIAPEDVFRLFDFGQLAFDNGESTYKCESTWPGMRDGRRRTYFALFSSFDPVTRAETKWEFQSTDQSVAQQLIDIVKLLTYVKNDIPGGAQINYHGWHWSLPAQQRAQGIPSQFVQPVLLGMAQRILWSPQTPRIDMQHPWYFDQAGDYTEVLLPPSLTSSTIFDAIDLGQLSDRNGTSLYSKIKAPVLITFGSQANPKKVYLLQCEVKGETGTGSREWRIVHPSLQVLQRVHKWLIGDSFIKPGPVNAHCVDPKIVFSSSAVVDETVDLRLYERYSAPKERYEIVLTRDIELSPEIAGGDAQSVGNPILRLPEKLFHDDGTVLVWIPVDHPEIEERDGQFSLRIYMVPRGADPDDRRQWLTFDLKSKVQADLAEAKRVLDLALKKSVGLREAHLASVFEGKIGRDPAFARVYSHDKPLPWKKLTAASAIKHLVLEFVDVDSAHFLRLFSQIVVSDRLRFVDSRIGRTRELAFYYTDADGAYSVPVIIVGANERLAANLLGRTRGRDRMRGWRASSSSDAMDSSPESASLPSQSPDFQRGARIAIWVPAESRLEIPKDWEGTVFLDAGSHLEVSGWGDISNVQVTVQEPFFRRKNIGGEIIFWNEDHSRYLFIKEGRGDIEVARAIATASEPEAKKLLNSTLLSSAKRGVSISMDAFSALQNMDSDRVRLFNYRDMLIPPTQVSDDAEKYRAFFKEVFPEQIYFTVFGKDDGHFHRLPFSEAADRVLIAMDIFDFRAQLSTKSLRDWRVALKDKQSPLSLDDWMQVRPLLLSHTGLRDIERLCKAKGLAHCSSIAGSHSAKEDNGGLPPMVVEDQWTDGPVKAETDRFLNGVESQGLQFQDIELHNPSADGGRAKTLSVAKMVIVGTQATGSTSPLVKRVGGGLVSLGSIMSIEMSPVPGTLPQDPVGWTSMMGAHGLVFSYGVYAVSGEAPKLAIWVEKGSVALLIVSTGVQDLQDTLGFIEDPTFLSSFVVVKDMLNLSSALASMPDADAILMQSIQSTETIGAQSAVPVSRQDIIDIDVMASVDEVEVGAGDVSTEISEDIGEALSPELGEAIDALIAFRSAAAAGDEILLAGSVKDAMQLWAYARELIAVASLVPGVGLLVDLVTEVVIQTITQYLLEIAVLTAATAAIMGNAQSEAEQLTAVKAQALKNLKSRTYGNLDGSGLGKKQIDVLTQLQRRFKDDVIQEIETSRGLVAACRSEHGGVFRKAAYNGRLVVENALESIPFWDSLVQKLAADVQDEILTEVSKADNDQAMRWKQAIARGFYINSPENFVAAGQEGEAAANVALGFWDELEKFEEQIRSVHLPDCGAIISGNQNTIISHGKLGKH